MKHSDYNKVMNDCHGHRKRNIQELRRDDTSTITTITRTSETAEPSDNRSVQVSKVSRARTIMGGKNEKASIRSERR